MKIDKITEEMIEEALEPATKDAYKCAEQIKDEDSRFEILSTLDFLISEVMLKQKFVNIMLDVINDTLDEEQVKNIVLLAYTIMHNTTIESTPILAGMIKPQSFKYKIEGDK